MLHHPFRLLLSIFLGLAALTQLVLSAPTKGVTEDTKVLGLKAANFESKARVLLYSSDKQTAWGRFPEYRNKADTQEIINAVKEVALAGYGYFSGTSGYFKTNLVAAMYDDQNGIFFSTIPHGKYVEELDGDIKKAREWRAKRQQLRQECKPEDKVFEESNSLKPNAPGWATAAGQKNYKPHAEDGVLYYYEKATGTRTSEVAERKETECWWLNSPKTYMSVFGLMPGEHIAKFHLACGEDNNNLSCEAMLQHFRIQQAPTAPLTRRSMGEIEARAAAKSKQHEDQDLKCKQKKDEL